MGRRVARVRDATVDAVPRWPGERLLPERFRGFDANGDRRTDHPERIRPSDFAGGAEAAWTEAIATYCAFLWDLGYELTSVFFHFRGGGIRLEGPRGWIRFGSGDDFESMDATVGLDGVVRAIDELPGAVVGPIMQMSGGDPLSDAYIDRRVTEWAETLRRNIDLRR